MTKHQKKKIYSLLRQLIALRDGEQCLKCGKTETLQMSHIYPKGTHRKMELDEKNLKLLCMRHHLFWWHKNPIEAWEWLRETLEPERIAYLKEKANTIDKTRISYEAKKEELEEKIKGYEL